MAFNKEKIKTAIDAVSDVCIGCESHSNDCPVSIAKEALKSLE